MTQAIEIMKTTIKCDSCEFETDGDVNEWHLKPCPECGAPDIVTDTDLAAFKMLVSLAEHVNATVGDVGNASTVTFKFDSLALKARGE